MLQGLMSSSNGRPDWIKFLVILCVALFVFFVVREAVGYGAGAGGGAGGTNVSKDFLGGKLSRKTIRAATWNIAAINNNPFEYWITTNDSSYLHMMNRFSDLIEKPSQDVDVKVSAVFQEGMAEDLFRHLALLTHWPGVNETAEVWRSDFANRSIISGFLKDGLLGRKRLASMPDRVTNTISGGGAEVFYRPSVINCYAGRLDSLQNWWTAWRDFMFKTTLSIKKGSATRRVQPYQLLSPISKAKYPSITTEEERISLPLQMLSLAIFDAILLHLLQEAGQSIWQPLRSTLCDSLNRKKNSRTLDILESSYSHMDVIFLQEVASTFHQVADQRRIATLFDIFQPQALDVDRDQNSFILLRKDRYTDVQEVTSEVLRLLNSTKAPVAKGDLLVLMAVDKIGSEKFIFASFHGDTNGLATKPVVQAIHTYAIRHQPKSKMLFGLDANTYASPEPDQQGVRDFAEFYSALKLNSCYGQKPNPLNTTTFNARTHLQPQLNKAVVYADKDKKGDKNPKDFILFFDADFHVRQVVKDNTGEQVYVEGMVFPTLQFPSDHGITSTLLEESFPALS